MRLALAEAGRARDAGRSSRRRRRRLRRAVDRRRLQPADRRPWIRPRTRKSSRCARRRATLGNYRLTGSTPLCDRRAVPDVRRRDDPRAHRAGRVRRARAEGRRADLRLRAHETPGLNHRLQVMGGVLEEECRRLMQEFFAGRTEKCGVAVGERASESRSSRIRRDDVSPALGRARACPMPAAASDRECLKRPRGFRGRPHVSGEVPKWS